MTDGLMDGWMDGWMDGCLDRLLAACANGWLARCIAGAGFTHGGPDPGKAYRGKAGVQST